MIMDQGACSKVAVAVMRVRVCQTCPAPPQKIKNEDFFNEKHQHLPFLLHNKL